MNIYVQSDLLQSIADLEIDIFGMEVYTVWLLTQYVKAVNKIISATKYY